MKIITQNEKILYIGIDVHKDSYSLCSFDFHKNELSDEMTIKATTKAVIKYLEAIKKKHTEKFFKWIKTVQFSEKWMQEAFNEYLAEVYSLKAKIELMDMKRLRKQSFTLNPNIWFLTGRGTRTKPFQTEIIKDVPAGIS